MSCARWSISNRELAGFGGIIGPKVIGTVGTRNALVAGFLVQAAATVPLVFLGAGSGWIYVLLATTFAGGVANLVVIVGFMVTATSRLPDEEQGLANGLATMSQQIGITMGIPVMSDVATARIHSFDVQDAHAVLSGVSVALTANAAACFLAAFLLALTLRATERDMVRVSGWSLLDRWARDLGSSRARRAFRPQGTR
ncbi:MFS transporter [Streptomyces sp. 142MFCol3.1]|uniref:MFS transporter n=1 Tax=Streptomyces sp. 142MFCol3.1 TaxID=1172179 RepID=UPI00131A1DD7|nr:MFS transporter [Streptomyces sp. 142MFCol3.1]